jgi:acetyltransferase
VAIVGASEKEGSVGRTLVENMASFQGKVDLVNPKRDEICGKPCYKSLSSLPEKPDLIVICTPAHTVPSIIQEAGHLQIPASIVISAGFKEAGEAGERLEKSLLGHGVRIIGPNCLGVMRPSIGLNATFAADLAKDGSIAFISQSGALCTAVLDWSLEEKVGFSAFVSIGSMAEVDFADLIRYFGSDPKTESILLYVESIGDARRFLSAAREVALAKPILMIKAGRTAESAEAAASHTGSMASSDDAMEAALKKVGVSRVDTIADLFSMASALSRQPKPAGPRLSILTNAGGPAVIATDALILSSGQLAPLSRELEEKLSLFLPSAWSHNNPIDLLGDASAATYAKALEWTASDPDTDAILVILTPQDMTDPTGTARALASLKQFKKPVYASWMGAGRVKEGIEILREAGIPNFREPDQACRTFSASWRHTKNLELLYEVPVKTGRQMGREKVLNILSEAKDRTLLDEIESKRVLEAYGIPVVPTHLAKSPKDAVRLASEIGYPVVLKLFSKTITHKSDVGGVKLNLKSKEDVEQAYQAIQQGVAPSDFSGVTVQPMIRLEGYELIFGSKTDPQFGPILLFGLGGQLVEVFQDRSLALPPLTRASARQMMQETKIYRALLGVRGRPPIDMGRLEEIAVLFSQLIMENPEIEELDINPLLASATGLIALDARVVINRKPHVAPAIRPYPSQYAIGPIRPIMSEDLPLLQEFDQRLSKETLRQRYLKGTEPQESLIRVAFADYDREIPFIYLQNGEIVALARLIRLGLGKEATFRLVVQDQWQHKGIGKELLSHLLSVAKEEGIASLSAFILEENFQMQKLCRSLGFSIEKAGAGKVYVTHPQKESSEWPQ